MNRYKVIWPWMIITVGAVLRGWQLTTAALWYDESFTLLVASRPLLEALQATAADVHPPAYYVIIWGLLRGLPWLPSVLVLRGFSLLCGIATMAVFWQLAGVLRVPRLPGLALLALSPVAIYYSQEGRMYALVQLLVVVQLLAILRGRWGLVGICGTLLVYTHNYGLFYQATLALIGLVLVLKQPVDAYRAGQSWLGPLVRPLLAMGLPWLLFVPWGLVLAGQMASVGSAYWIQPVTVGSVALAMQRGWVAVDLPLQLQVLATLSIGAGLVLLVLHAISHKRWLLLWWAAGPLLMAITASLIWKPVLLHRGLFGSLPALALLAGEAFTGAQNAGKIGRWLLLAPLALALAWQTVPAQPGTDHSGMQWPQPPAQLYHLEDTSLVVYLANWPTSQHYLIDSGCPEQISALTMATRAALGIKTIPLADLPAAYTLAATVGPLASSCQERVFHQLTDQAQPGYNQASTLGIYGVWTYDQ